MPEKAVAMRIEKIYEKVCGILSERKVFRSRRTDFGKICHENGAARVEIDNLLYERLGMSGEDILEAFREGKVDV